jgi:spermidine/putrescine transport system substrate-binding protein
MSRGRVEQIGTPEEIYSRPASVFVAGFIGSANLLPGAVADGAVSAVQLDTGARIEVPEVGGQGAGSPVTVMIRPERLNAVASPVEGRSLTGTISDVIFEGSWIRLIVHLPDHTEVMATADPDDDLPGLTAGAPITLSWSQDAPYVLAGRSAIVGATTTDVDEVQAALDGKTGESDDGSGSEGGSRFGRRALLAGAGVAGAAVVVAGVLKVTGDGGGKNASADAGTVSGGTLGTGESQVRILNWQAYIDPTEDGAVGTVDRFKQSTGIDIAYSEDLNDNNEFYAKEVEPYLGTGNVTNWDVMCPTNWMAARMKGLGWLEPLPLDKIPNRVNLEDRFLNNAWNFGATHSLPWQAGMTGLAYNPALTGRELRSVMDLFDPEFKGKVAMLTEMRDTLGLVMLGLGNDPSALNEDAAVAALEYIDEARASGQIRAFTGNEYLRSLESGDFVACLAWSGDIIQLNYDRPDIKFVLPEEGAMSWYDTMVIPKGAPNGYAAADWMNFVYDPVQAAQLTYWVQYISPVKGVRDELVNMGGDAAELADSPILFPSEEDAARLHVFAPLPDEVDARLTERFLKIIGG